MFDFAKAIESIGNAINGISDCIHESKERQSETEIIKDKKNLKKCSDIAEKIIAVTSRYFNTYSEKDKKEFIRLVKKFNKYN